MGCCLSGTSFYSDENKNVSLEEKDFVNLEITHMENFLHLMNNHYPRFSDISMPINYLECIINTS